MAGPFAVREKYMRAPRVHVIICIWYCQFFSFLFWGTILIYVFLIDIDVAHLFMGLFAISVSFLVNCLFKFFAPFLKLGSLLFIIEFREIFTYSRYKSFIGYVIFKYFLHVYGLFFSLFWQYFSHNKCFNFLKSNLLIFFLIGHAFGVISKNSA